MLAIEQVSERVAASEAGLAYGDGRNNKRTCMGLIGLDAGGQAVARCRHEEERNRESREQRAESREHL
jgi:hypothetical protein